LCYNPKPYVCGLSIPIGAGGNPAVGRFHFVYNYTAIAGNLAIKPVRALDTSAGGSGRFGFAAGNDARVNHAG
jgi:hypothetical protein